MTANVGRESPREPGNSGGLTDDNEGDADMTSVPEQPHTRHRAPTPACPICGRPPLNSYTNQRAGVIEQGHVDAREHAWTVRFIAGT